MTMDNGTFVDFSGKHSNFGQRGLLVILVMLVITYRLSIPYD